MITNGIGFFLNSGDTKELSQKGNSSALVNILRQSETAWAALWIEAPDKRRIGLKDLQKAALALQTEKIVPVLWTFPGTETLRQSAEWVGECYDALTSHNGGLSSVLVILDIEVDFKGKARAAREFVSCLQAVKASRPNLIFGFTSYPFGHSTLPWDEFAKLLEPGKSPVMPQLYTSGGEAKSIARAWKHYQGKYPGCEVVPVVASYIEDSRRLRKSLDLIVPVQNPSGVCVWVLRTTDEQEAKVLAEYAKILR